uniref:Uncharacterized protein n=1 Tax=Bird deltacoronavirus CalidrisCN24 TaxID=3237949 RepID=A0AB39AG49_9NIDO
MFPTIVYYCSILVFCALYGQYPTINELAQLHNLCLCLWFIDVFVMLPLTYLIFDTYDLHYIAGHIV